MTPATVLVAEETIPTPKQTGRHYLDMDGHWSDEAVRFVSEKGLMLGTTSEKFSPDMPATKGMVAVILWRMNGEAAIDGAGDLWYEPAALWAMQQELMDGKTLSQFAPEKAVSRQELATILFRLTDAKAEQTMELLQTFADKADIAPEAADALGWAVQSGLLVGRTDNTLAPQDAMTRAELAVVLMRFMEKYPSSEEK